MEFNILAANVRLLTKCLACIAKFSQELTVSIPRAYQVHLSTVNSSRSAFCKFSFSDEFFNTFVFGDPKDKKGKGLPLCIQAITKAILSTLRHRTVQASQAVESVTFAISDIPIKNLAKTRGECQSEDEEYEEDERDDEVNSGECRLVIRLDCKHGVTKTHRLHYSQGTILTPNASQDNTISSWSIAPSRLKKFMDHFQASTVGGGKEEISMLFSEEIVRLKNLDESIDEIAPSKRKRARAEKFHPLGTSTEVCPDIEEFDHYNVTGEAIITLNLKDFKTIISLADSLDTTIEAYFTTSGDPFHIKLSPPLVAIEFVIATIPGDPAALSLGRTVKVASVPFPPFSNQTASSCSGGKENTPRVSELPVPSTPRPPNPSQMPQEQVDELIQGIDMDASFDGDGSMDVDMDEMPEHYQDVIPDSTEKDVSYVNLIDDIEGNGIIHHSNEVEHQQWSEKRAKRQTGIRQTVFGEYYDGDGNNDDEEEEDDERLEPDSPRKKIRSKESGIYFA